jgi:hypothetical protein
MTIIITMGLFHQLATDNKGIIRIGNLGTKHNTNESGLYTSND